MGRRCCGTVQYGTPCRSPWCNACTTPRWQASQDRKHPGAANQNTKLTIQFSHFYVRVFGTILSCFSTRSIRLKDQCSRHYEMHNCRGETHTKTETTPRSKMQEATATNYFGGSYHDRVPKHNPLLHDNVNDPGYG